MFNRYSRSFMIAVLIAVNVTEGFAKPSWPFWIRTLVFGLSCFIIIGLAAQFIWSELRGAIEEANE